MEIHEIFGSSSYKDNPVRSYNQISWVYACANAIASTISSAPLAFYKKAKGSRTLIDKHEGHELYDLFNPPKSPEIPSLRDLLYRTYIHLGLGGLVYWVFTEKKGKLTDVAIRKEGEMFPIKNSRSEIIGWEYKKDGRSIEKYPANLVVVHRYYNPFDENTGLAPLRPAAMSILQEYSIAKWNAGFFRNGMKTPLVLETEKTLTGKQEKELRKNIRDFYTGDEGGHGAFIASGGIKATPVPLSSKDIDFIEGKQLTREEICAAYGVPPAIVGIFRYANYSNVKEQRKIFWEQSLFPKMYSMTSLIQSNILGSRYPDIEVDWALNEVHGLKPDLMDVAASAQVYFNMGYSKSEIALILDSPILDPRELKDQGAIPAPPAPPPGTAPVPGTPQNQPGVVKPPKPRLPTPNREYYAARNLRRASEFHTAVVRFQKHSDGSGSLDVLWENFCSKWIRRIYREVVEDLNLELKSSRSFPDYSLLKGDQEYKDLISLAFGVYSDARSVVALTSKVSPEEAEKVLQKWRDYYKDTVSCFLACSIYNRIKFLLLRAFQDSAVVKPLSGPEETAGNEVSLGEEFPVECNGLNLSGESLIFRDCVIVAA
jgi:HK97 family phage portal protein